VLEMCRTAGLVKLGNVAVDGTKIQAAASKHKAMSYDRMEKEEARLTAEIETMLKQAQAIDEQEDAEYGDHRGDELPAEMAFRESRRKKIQEAKATLEREAKEKAASAKREIEAREKEGKQCDPKLKKLNGIPDPKAQKNFTDPESWIMPSSTYKGSFVQGYNCQAAVDGESQIIIAADVTQETNDKKQAAPKNVLMDSGYFSEENIGKLDKPGMGVFIPPDRKEHGKKTPAAPRGRIPRALSTADRMRRKLQTKIGHATYAKRKEIVEPVFGQIKQARGFRQFLLRGVEKVKGEWTLICTTHNILKLWKSGRFKPGFAVS